MIRTLALAALAACGLAAAELTVYTEESPPINFSEAGKVTGSATDIVREVLKRAGQADKIEVVTWARGYKEVQEKANVALYSTTRNEKREKLFQWVGPVARKNWVLFARKGGAKVTSLEEAMKVKAVGTYKDDAKEMFLKEKGFANLDSATKDEANVKKLADGKIDLWITGDSEGPAVAKAAGVDPAILEPALVVKTAELYLAVSKQTDAATVKALTDAYDAMKADGSLDAIVKRWNATW
jgi:polar amino acid transport system substrate-binding protein